LTSSVHINPLDLSDEEFLAKAQEMCAGKAAYATRPEAVTFAKRRDFPVTPYACPWCDHWHLTSYDRVRAKAFNRRLKRLLRDSEETD
jgi:hypothetical protein